MEGVQVELVDRRRGRLPAQVNRQLMGDPGELPFQRRQQRPRLVQQHVLVADVQRGYPSRLVPILGDGELPALRLQEIPHYFDPRAQRRLPEDRVHDVRGKRPPRRLQFELPVIDLGPEALECAAVPPEQVEIVRNGNRRVVQGERAGIRNVRHSQRSRVHLPACGRDPAIHRGISRGAGPGIEILPCLHKSCPGLRQRRVLLQRDADQPVEGLGPEQRPPLRRDIRPGFEPLLRSARAFRRDRPRRLGARQIGRCRGRFRPPEIRSDGATRQHSDEDGRDEHPARPVHGGFHHGLNLNRGSGDRTSPRSP